MAIAKKSKAKTKVKAKPSKIKKTAPKKSPRKKTRASPSKIKAVVRKAKKAVTRTAARVSAAARKVEKAVVRTIAKKPAPKKKQQIVGEGDYAAGRKFLEDQAGFVKDNHDKIPELGRQAQQALDGPEGDSIRAAEQEARDRSTIE